MKIRTIQRREFLTTTSQIVGGMVVSSMIPVSPAGAADSSLLELSATAAVAAIRNGDIKAEDYARALLDRAQELASLNVFRSLDRDAVLEAARNADQLRGSSAQLGELHGLLIPVKDRAISRTKSKLRLLRSVTFAAFAWLTASSVYPSGGARTTASAAMLLPLPALFSIINCRLNRSASSWATSRAQRSAGPPAAKPTIHRTCRVG
jgi:hypothetical protein